MSLSDIISIPFINCLSISILLIGVSSIYFYQRISQQDHKISSMISLISSLADETEQQRLRLSGGYFGGQNLNGLNVANVTNVRQQLPTIDEEKSRLIEVSDDEYDSSDNSDSDGDDNSDDNSNDNSDDNSNDNSDDDNSQDNSDNESSKNSSTDSESDDDDQDDDDDEKRQLQKIEKNAEDSVKNIKINLENLGLANDDDELDDDFDDLSDIETDDKEVEEKEKEVEEKEKENDNHDDVEIDTLDVIEDLANDVITTENIKTIHLEQPAGDEHIDFSIFKSINLEEPAKPVDFVDYKKMSITKLREIVSKQGVPDASKLKKNDILKLLEVEQ